MDEIIDKILEAAVCAPSGENCQPWKFSVSDNRIYLFNVPERDDSLYSWGQRASYIAHGAAIENMSIAAETLGYKLSVELFPKSQGSNLVALLELVKDDPKEN